MATARSGHVRQGSRSSIEASGHVRQGSRGSVESLSSSPINSVFRNFKGPNNGVVIQRSEHRSDSPVCHFK